MRIWAPEALGFEIRGKSFRVLGVTEQGVAQRWVALGEELGKLCMLAPPPRFRVQGSGFRGSGVQGSGFRVQGSGFRVQGFRVQSSGF